MNVYNNEFRLTQLTLESSRTYIIYIWIYIILQSNAESVPRREKWQHTCDCAADMSFKFPPIVAEAEWKLKLISVCQTEQSSFRGASSHTYCTAMREIVHIQAGQCGNQIGTKVSSMYFLLISFVVLKLYILHLQKLFSMLMNTALIQ